MLDTVVKDDTAGVVVDVESNIAEDSKRFLENENVNDVETQEANDKPEEKMDEKSEEKKEFRTLFDDDEGGDTTDSNGVTFTPALEQDYDPTFDAIFEEADPAPSEEEEETVDEEGTTLTDEDDTLEGKDSYLSDEDDSDSEHENENENEHGRFETAYSDISSNLPSNDFLDHTGALIDGMYRRIASLTVGKADDENNVADEKMKLKSKRKSQKPKTKEEDELIREGSTSTGEGNTVGIQNSFSTESDDMTDANKQEGIRDDSNGDGVEFFVACGGCLEAEELKQIFPLAAFDDKDFNGSCKDISTCNGSEDASAMLESAIDRVQKQDAVKVFHKKFIAPCTSPPSDTPSKRTPPSEDVVEDGTDSILDGNLEEDKGVESELALCGPIDLLATECGSIDKVNAALNCGDIEDTIETKQEDVPNSDESEYQEPKAMNPARLQAEAKNVARAVMRYKPIQKFAATSNKTLHKVQKILNKNSSKQRPESKDISSPSKPAVTKEGNALKQESPVVRGRSIFPWDELGQFANQIPGDDPIDEPIDDKKNNDVVAPSENESDENVSPETNCPCEQTTIDEEIASLPESIRKSIKHAEMVMSASAYGPGIYNNNEDGAAALARDRGTEVSLIPVSTKPESTEGKAAKLDTTDTVSTLSSPSVKPVKEDDSTAGSSSSSAQKPTKKSKKAKKRRFWRSKKSKTDDNSQRKRSVASIIYVSRDRIEVTTPTSEVEELLTKKKGLRKEKTSDKPKTAALVQP